MLATLVAPLVIRPPVDPIWAIAITALVAPVALEIIRSRQRRKEKEHEWARQDALAETLRAQNEESARLLVESNAESARLLAESNAATAAQVQHVAVQAAEAATLLVAAQSVVVETAQSTGERLNEIHELVNSSYTATLKRSQVALRGQEALLVQNAVLRQKLGLPEDPALRSTVDAIKAEIQAIDDELQDRATLADGRAAATAPPGVTLA